MFQSMADLPLPFSPPTDTPRPRTAEAHFKALYQKYPEYGVCLRCEHSDFRINPLGKCSQLADVHCACKGVIYQMLAYGKRCPLGKHLDTQLPAELSSPVSRSGARLPIEDSV